MSTTTRNLNPATIFPPKNIVNNFFVGMRMENHLVRHNFEVIDPFARDASEAELNTVMEKAKQDSLMMGLRPGEATSRSIQFVVDRERARDREFSGRHDPENAASSRKNATL